MDLTRRAAVRALGALLAGLTGLGPRVAAGEAWGGLVPGETRRAEVEARYGRPTRERTVTEEGRTGAEWTYLAERAPRGLDRMVVSFGLIRPEGFVPDLVRSVAIYPRPRVFTVETIAAGWGTPDAIATEEATGRPAFRYDARGLFVILDRTGAWAEMLLFAPPQAPAPR